MATAVTFGGSTSTTAYTDGYAQSSGIGVASGNTLSDGGHDIIITALLAYAAGRGAARTCTITFAGASTGGFTLGSAGSAAGSTGWKSCSTHLGGGGSGTFRVTCNGSFYFAHGGSGSATDNYGTDYSGAVHGGYEYVEGPTAPTLNSVNLTGTAGEIQVNFSAPSDNGGSSITGYRIFYWGSAEATRAHYKDVTASGSIITGLTPGDTYTIQVVAKNAVTTAAGATTYSAYSGTKALFVPSGGKIWSAATAAWKNGILKKWDAVTAGWITGKANIYDGTTDDEWKDAQ